MSTLTRFYSIAKRRWTRATVSDNFIRWMMIYRDPLIHYVDDIFEFVNFNSSIHCNICNSNNFILRVTVLGIPRYRVTGMVICELINDIYGELMSTLTRFYSIGKRRWTRATVSDNFIRWMMIYRDPLIHYVDDIFEFVNFNSSIHCNICNSNNFILRVTVLEIPRYREW